MSSTSLLSFQSITTHLRAKEKEIENILGDDPNTVDLWKLRELALSDGGLINDSIRNRAWPLLIGIYSVYSPSSCAAKKKHGTKRFPSQKIKNSRRPKRHRPNHLRQSCSKEEEREFLRATASSPICATSASSSLINDFVIVPTTTEGENNTVPFFSLDAQQIELDVARCTRHLFNEQERAKQRKLKRNKNNQIAIESLLREKQKRLDSLINLSLLRTYEDDYEGDSKLRYYQGYHDVASVFLSTLDEGKLESPSSTKTARTKNVSKDSVKHIASSMGLGLCSSVLTQISKSHFGDAMKTDFLQLRTTIQLVWMPLLNHFDQEIHEFLYACEMEPFFLLSWIITWFSHDIHDTSLVKRLFDVFLVSHPMFPLYLALAMVCHPNNREEILMTECDFAAVHVTLSGLPKNSDTAESSFVNEFSFDSSESCLVGREVENNPSPSLKLKPVSSNEYLMFLKHDDETPSLAPTSPLTDGSSCSGVKAPFQEIIDLALKFMERIPPSSVLNISQHYFLDDQFEPMVSIAPSIVMLQPHPWWGLVSSPEAGCLLRQGKNPAEDTTLVTNQKLKQQPSQTIAFEINGNDENVVFIRWHSKNSAVIACGYGRGERVFLKHRLLKRFALLSAAFIAFLPTELWSITEVTKQLDINYISSYFDVESFSSVRDAFELDSVIGRTVAESCLLEDYELSFLTASLSTCDIH